MKNHYFRAVILIMLVCLGASERTWAQRVPVKKNARPKKTSPAKDDRVRAFVPVFSYEFTKAEFNVSHILIEHGEKGIGRITFRKRHFDEEITEPLSLSEKTIGKIAGLWNAIRFLDSDVDYQSPVRDYPHLGTVVLRMEKGGRERETTLNWTDDKQVKELLDAYRGISNQFVWIFDMNVARENQPLETPRILKALDSYLRLKSIADPQQMLPYLKSLSADERVPLIARNHAARIASKIAGAAEKNE